MKYFACATMWLCATTVAIVGIVVTGNEQCVCALMIPALITIFGDIGEIWK